MMRLGSSYSVDHCRGLRTEHYDAGRRAEIRVPEAGVIFTLVPGAVADGEMLIFRGAGLASGCVLGAGVPAEGVLVGGVAVGVCAHAGIPNIAQARK